ncbi:SDR family NAD(P)-dependent oxidoreductase [Microvirga massiliensis]|uniref:SDR family NAD(P)-dependent oxidoreductase n=1 Tax=Microvirga massiliensis TaxID=1033741 RepID=UPI00062BB1B8|nr:glucose 1-dehydrogenase [Microvirga massiliensis]
MTRALDLTGKVAIVTGAGGGIGAATCRALAEQGAIVIAADRDDASAGDLVATLKADGYRADAAALDVTDEKAVAETFESVTATHGAPDILVNNAGLSIRKGVTEISLEEWNRVFDVNVTGAFLCAREAARRMVPRRSGTIVNVASIMGFSGGGPYPNPAYQASKGALVNLTRALAVELAPASIRVNGVAPTWVRTAFIGELTKNEEAFGRITALMPLGRIAEPEEVAAAILFLASPMASMTTGHILPVDGGFLAQ